MGKWTPGPWRARHTTNDTWVDAPAMEIPNPNGRSYHRQILEDGDYPEKQADARLIAEAPAMAEALEQTAAAMDALHPSSAGDMSDADYARLWNATRDALEAILARINGDAP